jgi:predicted MFS family arabinose efflux permease
MSANGSAGISTALTVACAIACGAMVANLYYAQPLIALIAPALHLGEGLGGWIVTLTQLGYAAGLLLIVSLADRVENRRLILISVLCTAVALVALALAPSAALFLAASVLVGFFAAGAQVIVPFAASLAPEERRGRTIGNVMSGLLAGIMLARPAAGVIADFAGWRMVFWVSAGLMLLLAFWLARALPRKRPTGREHYGLILLSLGRILLDTPALRRRAIYQGLAFAIFNIFWTASPLLLAHQFNLGQKGIALFALAGAGGALAAPLAGRLGDRGHVRLGTALALSCITLCCFLSAWAGVVGSLLALVIFAVALDAGTQINQVLGQRVIYSLPGEARGRLNAIYMTIVFVLGAGGSAAATLSFHLGGWRASMLTAAGLGVLVLLVFATELLGSSASKRNAATAA